MNADNFIISELESISWERKRLENVGNCRIKGGIFSAANLSRITSQSSKDTFFSRIDTSKSGRVRVNRDAQRGIKSVAGDDIFG